MPPDLSPLDAFAAQSRLLAQKLEENSQGENRISRLLPDTIAQSFSQARNMAYGLTPSSSPQDRPISPDCPSLSGQRTTIETLGIRHMSICPSLYDSNDYEEVQFRIPPNHHLTSMKDNPMKDKESSIHQVAPGYFGAIGTQSSTLLQGSPNFINVENSIPTVEGQPDFDPLLLCKQTYGVPTDESVYYLNTLASKSIPLAFRSPSLYSTCNDSSDDDSNSATKCLTPVSSHNSKNENSSNSISSAARCITRTYSNSSEASANAAHLSKPPQFNFSRPLTRCSANIDIPLRNESLDRSESPHIPVDEIEKTCLIARSEALSDTSSENAPSSPYMASNCVLPRGKIPLRNSEIPQGFLLSQSQIHSSDQVASAASSPLIRSTTSSLLQKSPLFNQISSSTQIRRPSTSSSASSMPLLDPGYVSHDWPPSMQEAKSRPETTSSTEPALTFKTKPTSPTNSTVDLTASEHVEKAIEYHQAGILNKSTYHLRLAARKGHPTGMLLYALACRHGWGMRPNQREGVVWLRKAADEAVLEIADDENMKQSGKQVDITELRSKKAQFALSIYELGVSHMNGWGIEQDKALGLRCFEIAGSWGDADAMAEAGFCYAQGVGCKKNLKKSAKFYRQAEAKGLNMIGNSWYESFFLMQSIHCIATNP